ncbi:MAG: alpha/beta hydrolase [Kiritimatiellia bacterium]
MALVECHFFSEALGMCMSMTVVLPQRTGIAVHTGQTRRSVKYPTLFLLHGLSDDHTIWLRRTSIERYVAQLDLAVVMPAVHRSFYADMKHGGKYWTFISSEVPALAREFFPLSSRREDNFVAGLSMGGYGAFKLALNCPEHYRAAASLSGALYFEAELMYGKRVRERYPELHDAFGSPRDFRGSVNDLRHAALQLIGSCLPRPKLYQCCGLADPLLDMNRRFKTFIERLGFDLTYEEEPGDHTWEFWDSKIQRVLEWLPLCKRKRKAV